MLAQGCAAADGALRLQDKAWFLAPRAAGAARAMNLPLPGEGGGREGPLLLLLLLLLCWRAKLKAFEE